MNEQTFKTALVTGGSRGIGAATAVELARHGMDVAIVARRAGGPADEVRAKIEQLGQRCLTLTADMADPAACRSVVDQTIDAFGGVDVLIHNAGGPEPGGLLSDEAEQRWYAAFDVHVHAAFHLMRSAVPSMQRRGGGSVILVASVAGLRGVPGILPYATVKGALYEMARSAAAELAPDNIRVNAVSPGIIRTDFHAGMTEERKRYNEQHRIPLRREGTPEQVAEAMCALALNAYITGENLTVDGGLTMHIR